MLSFNKIIGQNEVKKILSNSIKKSNVSHAYIFSGEKGIGKRTLAMIFAKILLCNDKKEAEECGRCNVCNMLVGGKSPDLFCIDHKKNSISVDEVRTIKSHASIMPMYSKKKVYIIEDADRLTVQGQNSLLKLFEEPPEYTVIILTTAKYDSLLETIRSRAVRINFKVNTKDEIESFLRESSQERKKNEEFLIAYSNGIIGKLKDLLEDEEFILQRNDLFTLMESFFDTKIFNFSKTSKFFEENKDDFKIILDMMEFVFRDMILIKYNSSEKMLINFDKKDIMFKWTSKIQVAAILNCIDVIETTKGILATNTNFSLALDVLIMKLREELGE